MIINLIFTFFAAVIGFVSFDYYRSRKRKNVIDRYLFGMGLGCTMWCLGYALMGMNENMLAASLFRMLGIIGMDLFFLGECLWLAYRAQFTKGSQNALTIVLCLIQIGDVVLFGYARPDWFARVSGRTVLSQRGAFADIYHNVYLVFLVVLILVLHRLWGKRLVYKRDRRFRRVVALVNLFMLALAVPDVLLPLFGIRFFSSSSIGAALTYVCMIHIARKFYEYDIDRDNLSRFMYRHSDFAFFAFDPERYLIVANPASKKLLDIQKVRGQRISELFDLQGLSEKALFDKVDSGEDSFRLNSLYGNRECALYISIARDENGEPYCYLCASYDMSREAAVIEELSAATTAKSAFLASMSHEIRTPINAILGMNEMILREVREETIRDYAEQMEEAGRLLLSTVNDILDYSKLESGKMGIIPVEYRLSNLLNELTGKTYEWLAKKSLSFKLEVDQSLPEYLYGDEVRISQILMNLLSNACKYTKEGSITFKVSYDRLEEEEILLKASVKDTGKGIRKEDQKHIFSAFEWADQDKSKNVDGTGLGLTIAATFAHMMQGDITLESEYGQGAEFTLTVPQKVVSFDPIGDYESRFKLYLEDKENENANDFIAPRARILVADDNVLNLKVFTYLLRKTQIQVDTAGDGAQALKMAKENHYHMIFLDHLMPQMDGIESLHRMQERHICDDLPVIALTANAVSGAREMYQDYGFTDYLCKPIDVKNLERFLLEYLPENLIIREDVGKGDKYQETASLFKVGELKEPLFHERRRQRRTELSGDEMTHIFIINPIAGSPKDLAEIRDSIESHKEIRSFVFTSSYEGNETELVRKAQHYFDHGLLRFYAIGGSGTARNVLNGIEDFDRCSLAFCPRGLTNDFFKALDTPIWPFREINRLITGQETRVDYIKTNHGNSLNTVSLGLDATIVDSLRKNRGLQVFGKNVPYVLSILGAMFKAKSPDYEIYVDDKLMEGKFGQIFFGNGSVLGGSLHFMPGANVTDGEAGYVICRDYQGLSILPLFITLQKADQEALKKYAYTGVAKKITIRRKDEEKFDVNFDGELSEKAEFWEAEIVHRGLRFVVPREVQV